MAAIAMTLATLTSALAAAPAHAAAPITFQDGHGLHVLDVTRVDERDYDATVLSPDIGRPIHVRVLVPAGYTDNPARRYPVLYLFHGTGGYVTDWVKAGHAEQTTAPYDLITVMPEVGFNGDGGFWFTNWVDRATSHGPSQFEHYLIDSLVPWVDQNLRTIADRDGRAVAGLSQGGYGSTEMAARHPDMFVSVASFSGAPEIARDPEVFAGAIAVIEAIEVGEDRVPPFSELGSPVLDRINWRGHDPATLIDNLRGMDIDLWTGMGVDGPYDATPDPAGSGIEALVYQSTQHFYQHLVAEHIPAYYDNYVFGTHSFPYWARDLQAYLPRLMAAFAHPTAPAAISYTSIDRTWSQWGYDVALQRSATQQFSTLRNGSAQGFTFTGSGTASVTTPDDYLPHHLLTVTTTGADRSTQVLSADSAGRLHVTLALGSHGETTVSISPQPAA